VATRFAGRWALVVAVVFCAYSALLLVNAFRDRGQLREAAERRLVADSQRRASTLADFAGDRVHLAEDLSALNELNTYLSSKALGMSPLYGLNASLDALERRFRDRTAPRSPAMRAMHQLPFSRIVFFDEAGQPLADSGGSAALPPAAGLSDVRTRASSIGLSPDRRQLVASVPVMFKDQFSGTLVAMTDVAELYRSLIQVEEGDAYRETMLTLEGQEIIAPPRPAAFSVPLARALAQLPENRPTLLADVPGAGSLSDAVAIVTAVPGMPLRLVTTQPRESLDGALASPAFLYSLGVLPALLLLLALRFDRLRHRANALERDATRAVVQRRSLEDRNEALSVEIQRREAVEAELQGHRDHLEDLVEQRTAELARLFHALPDLYFRTERDGTILECRAGRTEDLLMPVEELLGRRMQDIVPPEVGVKLREALNGIAIGAEQVVIEYELALERGVQHFEARMLPLADAQVVLVVRNVTDRHDIDAVREMNRLDTERLARAKSEFMTNMSHEIRTPLNAVLGLAQVGARSASDPAARAAFKPIENAGRHLLAIVNDILDFSKLEAGKLSVERQPFRLAAAVEVASGMVAGRVQGKGLELRVELAPGLPEWVEGDELRLKQVLVNLLSNAVKFTERGTITLSVTPDGEQVAFAVGDSGIGISPEQLAQLFQPFQQADLSTTRRFGGTGLGLSISHDLADLMGGDLIAASRLGEGSTFTLRLPLPVAAPPGAAPPGPSAPNQRLRGMRLLAAEDNEVNCLVLESMLEFEGAQVVFVGNGFEAVNAMNEEGASDYQAVLMDVQMPVMDGLEATRRILASNPTVRVIGLTAHALEEERERCRAAGMVEHLAKPVELDELVAALQRCARQP
jgi:signal transduction histidine kinase/CheY-like chemotaxis protein